MIAWQLLRLLSRNLLIGNRFFNGCIARLPMCRKWRRQRRRRRRWIRRNSAPDAAIQLNVHLRAYQSVRFVSYYTAGTSQHTVFKLNSIVAVACAFLGVLPSSSLICFINTQGWVSLNGLMIQPFAPKFWKWCADYSALYEQLNFTRLRLRHISGKVTFRLFRDFFMDTMVKELLKSSPYLSLWFARELGAV